MKAIEFARLSRYPETAYTIIPANSEPDDELADALEMFWLNGAIVTGAKGDTTTHLIYLQSRTPFETEAAYRVRLIDIEAVEARQAS